MFTKLSFPIVIELGVNNSVTATHYSFVDVIQGYQVKTLHTATFRLSLLQSTNWIWWAYDYISERKMLLHNRVFKGTYDCIYISTCLLCTKCTFDCHNPQSASRQSTSNGSLEHKSSALPSAIQDATWIWQTYVECRRQQDIVSRFSPQPTSIRWLRKQTHPRSTIPRQICPEIKALHDRRLHPRLEDIVEDMGSRIPDGESPIRRRLRQRKKCTHVVSAWQQ